MEKSQQTTDNGQQSTDYGQQTTATVASYEAARGVMMRLGVTEIWYTTDGQWFTSMGVAEAHAANVEKEVKYFKIKKF